MLPWNRPLTVKELDDVCKVHPVHDNDIPVSLQQGQRQEQHKLTTGHVLGRPNALPRRKDVRIDHLPLKVQQEPTVAKVKVCVVAVRVHQVVHLRVQNLDQGPAK